MKRINYLLVLIAALSLAPSCKNVNFKKTKSGLLYKIISSGSKDSVAGGNDWLKLHFTQKLNDSVLQTSYGKMPVYARLADAQNSSYNPGEIFNQLKKGDSAITVVLIDSLMRKGLLQQLPPFMKKGDRISTYFKVLDIFRNDSLYEKDKAAEAQKDLPRQMKEQEEQTAKMQKERDAEQIRDIEELEKSGEAAKEIKKMEAYLAGKKINAQKTGKGTYVFIQQQGTGPDAALGKYVKVKYTGKILTTDSVFESSVYPLHLGKDPVIRGWTDGLQMFKQGGKGTIYIPGYLGYGKNPGPGGKPLEAMIFDVEILEVSDQPIAQAQQQPPPNH